MASFHKKKRIESRVHTYSRIKKWTIIFFVILIIIFLACVGVMRFFNHERFSIQEVIISGNEYLSADEIQHSVDTYLSDTYVFHVSKQSLPLLSRKKLRTVLLNEFPRIELINIKKERRTKNIVLQIQEFQPAFVWCDDVASDEIMILVTPLRTCYFVNQFGYVFDTAPYFKENPYVMITDIVEPDSESRIGTFVLYQEDWTHFQELVTIHSSQGFLVQEIQYLNEYDWSFLIRRFQEQRLANPVVLLYQKNITFDTMNQLLGIVTTEKSLQNYHQGVFEKLKYIDMRFSNRIFYQ